MDNKNIYIFDKRKNYARYSAEGLHSLNLNRWKDWYCNAGVRSLYIDFDGNVWRATCNEGGWMGNINSATGLTHLPELTDWQWVKCTKEVCSCGADMSIPKVKDESIIPIHFEYGGKLKGIKFKPEKEIEHIMKPDIVYSKEVEEFRKITWDIGRLCNFECHYCSADSHNNFDPVKNLKFFLNAYNNIKIWNPGNERIKFVITGGEPTVYKDYLPFVKTLKEDGHIIHTTTNGSNTPAYYSELAKYSDLAFSIHLNYVKHFGVDKFLNSVKAATETTEIGHQEDTDAKYNWNIVRIMLDPGNLDIAKETYNRFKEQFKDCKNFVLAVDLVHDIMGGKTLYKYSDEELSWLETTH